MLRSVHASSAPTYTSLEVTKDLTSIKNMPAAAARCPWYRKSKKTLIARLRYSSLGPEQIFYSLPHDARAIPLLLR